MQRRLSKVWRDIWSWISRRRSPGDQRRDAQVFHFPSGLGGPEDPSSQTWFAMPMRIPQTEADAFYAHWVGRRVVDTLPEAAGREWGRLDVGGEGDPSTAEKVAAELKRLGAQTKFVQAQRYANLYGGAGIVMVAQGGGDPADPIDWNTLRAIEELRVVDGWHLFPVLEHDTDPLRPERYRLLSTRGNVYIHRSRVLRFDGLPVPPDVMRVLDGWSDSVLRNILEPCRAYQLAIQSVAAAVRDYEILVHSVSHLSTLLKDPGAQSALQARARRNRQMLATFRTLFVDKEAEELQFLTRDFKGVAEAVDLLRRNLLAASGLPPAIFEGQFPSGLGATGISERLQWADQVRAFQESHWRRPIEQLLRLLFRAGIPEPEYWHWEWNSVFQLNDEELLRMRNLQAQTDALYIREGVLLAEEVAQSRFGGSNYSFETVLDPELRKVKLSGDPFAAVAEPAFASVAPDTAVGAQPQS